MIDPKKLGPTLLAELQRRSLQKNADKETLLEALDDGSGAHVFVGEKDGNVSLLVPIEDGFEGPKRVQLTVAGAETVILDDVKKDGTVQIEGRTFARFILDPLKYNAELDAAAAAAAAGAGAAGARPTIALRGEGPDGLWSPLGFDDWFMADYATLRWLATTDQMIVAPEVRVDARDPSWKQLDGAQRDALEKLLQRPLPSVVHESVLAEALAKAKSAGGVIEGALESLALTVEKPKRGRPSNQAKLDKLDKDLKDKAELEALRRTNKAHEASAAQSAQQLADAAATNQKLVSGDERFHKLAQNAELSALKREQLVVDLTPGAWARAGTDKAAPGDALLDATLFLSDLRASGSAKTLGALQRRLGNEATRDKLSEREAETIIARYTFPDGSRVVVGLDDDENLRSFILAADGRRVDVDFDKQDLFRLPVLHDPGPAAAQVDEAMLVGPHALRELAKLGFTPASDRLFTHADGSWVALVPPKPARPGVKVSHAPRIAAGFGDRQFDIKAPSTQRGNPFAALPAWLQQMVRLSPPAENVDLQLLARSLGALDEGMLARLRDAGYTFEVTRYRVSNAQADLRDESVTTPAGRMMIELADGVHRGGGAGGGKPSIVLRTYFDEGQLRVDTSTLLNGIGRAFDVVIGDAATPAAPPMPAWQVRAAGAQQQQRAAPGEPLHKAKDYQDAFDKEHQRLPKIHHTAEDFVAETFALYMLDAVRCKRQFPLAFAAHDKRFKDIKPDAAKLFDVERAHDRAAVANVAGGDAQDLRKVLAFAAQQNRVLRENGMPARPLVVHLEGKRDWGSEQYVADAARHVRNSFGHEAGVYRSGESFVNIAPGTFNSADDMEKLLTEIETSGRAAVLYVDAHQIARGSAGFKVIEQWVERGRDVPPLVLAGDSGTLDGFKGEMPSVLRMSAKLDALSPAQQVEQVKRMAAQDGFLLAAGVTELLEMKLKGGGYTQAAEAWQAVKTAQFERMFTTAQNDKEPAAPAAAALSSIREITKADVAAMKVSTKKTPQERLAEMIGQDAAKRQIDAITKQAKVAALRAAQGLPDPSPPRLNLLFSGAPGTGKTTFAEIMGALLQETGAIKNPNVTKVTIQDLLSGSPEAAVKALFEANKGGVIFLDEMHQLKDTAEGKRAFRAMIPYLADPAYADTVFIGAGYSDELGQLVRDVDPGAERRFTTVPFMDYKREELAQILDIKARAQNFVLDDKSKEAALAFLDYRKRITKNFGNAGEVDIALAHAQKAQTLRIAELPQSKITKKVLMALEAQDFTVPAPITKESFWAEMDQMSGWDDVKALLKQMAASIEGAVKRGKAPTDAVEPYWIVDGPPGTGKSTLARMLSKFGAAYGLTALPEVIDVQGANFQGEYVGQTAGVVVKQFEKAWGRLMFVDEVSGLAKSGGEFKFEAAKIILAQTENHRGKFMMVVADYAENINQFLALDPGLPRRFGNRITLKPWTAEQAGDDLEKKLADENVTLTPAAQQALAKGFAELVAVPGYASGGDVRTLKGAIIALLDARPAAGAAELPGIVQEAFAGLIEKKRKDAAGSAAAKKDG